MLLFRNSTNFAKVNITKINENGLIAKISTSQENIKISKIHNRRKKLLKKLQNKNLPKDCKYEI